MTQLTESGSISSRENDMLGVKRDRTGEKNIAIDHATTSISFGNFPR